MVLGTIQLSFASGKPPSAEVRTNLVLLGGLIERITGEIASEAKLKTGDSISINVSKVEDGWIVVTAASSALKTLGCSVFSTSDSTTSKKYLLDFTAADLSVRYDSMFNDSFLGTRSVRRTVSGTLRGQVLNTRTGEILSSSSRTVASADSVRINEIPGLESVSVKSTHGEIPAESFLDRAVEPVMIIGATGIAIYLFFHVRN